ncbi:TonB-dependent receptor [Capnocytophaga canis]|nr:TonB-dependent receptor [Capnocytophaga canis]
MKMNRLTFLIFFLFTTVVFAQTGTVSGRIVDAESKEVLPYTEVSLFSSDNKNRNFGVISDENGKFLLKNIPFGEYTLKISFVGYEDVTKPLSINASKTNLGDVLLHLSVQQIEEVVVEGRKAAFSYQVDRKTINASAFPEANTAIDLLTNVPSLNVSVDGRITYREGGTFTVYINGIIAKDGQERLRTLDASQIEKIDIITNPSAKYSASGTAGIIRVVLKKNKLEGYAINLSAEFNTLERKSFSYSIDKKGKKGGWHVSGNIADHHWGDSRSQGISNVYAPDGKRFETLFNSEYKANMNNSFIDFGFNYDITDRDFIDVSIDYVPFRKKEKKIDKTQISENTFDKEGNLLLSKDFLMDVDNQFLYQNWGANLEYSHFFNKDKSHFLKLNSGYSFFIGSSDDFTKGHVISPKENTVFGNKSSEKNEIFTKSILEYELPLTDATSIEAGVDIETDHIPEITTESGFFKGDRIVETSKDVSENQVINYKENIYAGYFSFKSSFGKFEYKLGLRSEHTARDIIYSFDNQQGVRKNDRFKKNFTDWFPSVHLLYSFSQNSQISGNYSRRISRPEYWVLVPAFVWNDKYSFLTGNSRLLPSYTDSYELAYKNSWGKDFVSIEMFARNQHDIMSPYSRVYRDNMLLITRENVGSSWATGIELMAGVDVFKWWNVNASFTAYHYRQDLEVDANSYPIEQWRFNAKLNHTLRLPRNFLLRVNMGYQSPTKDLQNNVEAIFLTNASFTKTWKDNRWSLSLFGSNVFDSYRYTKTNVGENFSKQTKMTYRPYVGFSLKYQFNNQK